MTSFVRTISREKFNLDLTVGFSCYLYGNTAIETVVEINQNTLFLFLSFLS